jgi:hypothetical protein
LKDSSDRHHVGVSSSPIGANVIAGQPAADHSAVRRALARFDPMALASALGALQLLPENAMGVWRLGLLSGMVSGLEPGCGTEALTDQELGHLVNEGSVAEAAAVMDDPPEGVVAEELVFYGGSYLVGEGLGESDIYTLRRLASACFRPGALPEALQVELRDCWVAALKLSDTALRAAGLVRNAEPMAREVVEVPDAERLIELQKAVSFGRDRLGSLMPPRFITALEPLIAEVGDVDLGDQELAEGAADARPFLRSGEWIILARPMAIPSALRHHLALRVAEECGPERLARLFGAAVDHDVLASLRRMGLSPVQRTERLGGGFSEIEASLDFDKRLHMLILADDYEGLDPADPYSVWDGSAAATALDRRLGEIEAGAAEEGEAPLMVLVMQAAGRLAMMLAPEGGGGEEVSPILLTAADLEAIAVMEAEDPLALWKFASALARLQETTTMRMSSMLDVYGAWREGGRSFGSSGEMTHVSFMPGYAGPVRIEAARARDRHSVAATGNALREVERRTTPAELDLRDRIYYELGFGGPRLSISVAGAPIGLWVSGPEDDLERSFDAVESVAYWLGELSGSLTGFLDGMAGRLPAIEILTEFDPPDYWFASAEDPGGESFGAVELLDRERAVVRLGAAMRRTLPRADNQAERELVVLLMEALGMLGAGVGVGAPDEAERAAVLEAVAPPGTKKHLILMPAELNRAVAEPEGPPRIVQEADRTEVRHRLGRALDERFGLRGAEVPEERRGEVLNAAVELLFEEITANLDGCCGAGLLERLMAMNERLIATSEHRRAILPARLATYPQAALRLREEVAEANLASICARFLVEYAAAAAPDGEEPISLATYDRALAAAAELLDWADLSDAIHGGLSRLGLRFDRDGVLRAGGVDRYEAGRSELFDRHIAGERRDSERQWAGRFERSVGEGRPAWLERVDGLFVAEAGVPLHILGETLVAANQVAFARRQDVVAMPRAEAVAAMAEAIERELEEIEKAVGYLSLSSRADFLKPPGGKGMDVYPWRYARRWSYNRRPFVRRIGADGEDELLWGQRQVFASFIILYGQIESGRYQELAAAPELKSELGRLADQEGASFEERVAAAVEALGLPVARAVKRLGGEKLRRSPSEDLGDIDVLAADPARKTLWAIECKSLAGSLGSSEVVLEMTAHFDAAKTSSISKHAERVAWVRERMSAALERLDLAADVEGWELRGLIVTGRDALAPFIDDLTFACVPFQELAGFLADPPASDAD